MVQQSHKEVVRLFADSVSEEEEVMKYFTPQNLLIAGAIYFLFFRGKNASPYSLVDSGGVPMGEGYP